MHYVESCYQPYNAWYRKTWSYYFADSIGLYYHQYDHWYKDWGGPTETTKGDKFTYIGCKIDTLTYSFNKPTLIIPGNLIDRKKEEFPFNIIGQYTHPYPLLIDTILVHFNVFRNDSLVLGEIFTLSSLSKICKIDPDTSKLQPGDICKVKAFLYDKSIFNYVIPFPADTGYLQFKILPSPVVEADKIVAAVSASYALEQNYPNPFNPSTTINVNLPVGSEVVIKVYNIIGEEIVTLFDGNLQAGTHRINFNVSASGGLNSGVYFYRLYAYGIDGSSFSSIKKMILSK